MSSSTNNDRSRANVEFLNDDQAVEFFDKQSRALLGLPGREFLDRLERGEFKSSCDNPKILKLMMLIPKSIGRDNK